MTNNKKCVLVTGAARGIGYAVAEAFAEQGATVICADLLDDEGKSAVARLFDRGYSASFVRLDVTDQAAWSQLAADIERDHGTLDVLVHCAGIMGSGAIETVEYPVFRQVMEVNVGGTYNALHTIIPLMTKRDAAAPSGCIINIASMASFTGLPFYSAYAASKAAVLSLTNSAALECARQKYPVRVNSIHPGTIDTEMARSAAMKIPGMTEEKFRELGASRHPVGRLGTVADVVHAVLYLADERASFTTGLNLRVDGGRSAGEF